MNTFFSSLTCIFASLPCQQTHQVQTRCVDWLAFLCYYAEMNHEDTLHVYITSEGSE